MIAYIHVFKAHITDRCKAYEVTRWQNDRTVQISLEMNCAFL